MHPSLSGFASGFCSLSPARWTSSLISLAEPLRALVFNPRRISSRPSPPCFVLLPSAARDRVLRAWLAGEHLRRLGRVTADLQLPVPAFVLPPSPLFLPVRMCVRFRSLQFPLFFCPVFHSSFFLWLVCDSLFPLFQSWFCRSRPRSAARRGCERGRRRRPAQRKAAGNALSRFDFRGDGFPSHSASSPAAKRWPQKSESSRRAAPFLFSWVSN